MNNYVKLAGKIKVHPTTWAVAGIAVMTAHFKELMMLFSIIFIHEMGHAIAAAFCKWRIKSITILPFGGMLETEEHGNKSLKEELYVVIFGPLQHLWLFLLAFAANRMGMMDDAIFQTFAYMNGAVCLFNLLPIWPLDGGKLVFISLSKRMTFLDSMRTILAGSAVVAAVLFLVSVLIGQFSLNLLIVFLFIAFTLYMDWKQRKYAFMRFLLERHYGNREELLQLKPIKADESESIQSVLKLFQRGCKHPVIIMKDGEEKGSLDENELLHAYFSDKLTDIKLGELLYYR